MKLKEIKPICVTISEAAKLLSVRRKDISTLVGAGTLTLVKLAEGLERITMASIVKNLKRAEDETLVHAAKHTASSSLSNYRPGNYQDLKEPMTCGY